MLLDGLIARGGGGFQHEKDPGEPILHTKRYSVTIEEAEILKLYAKGCRVLEIGTGLGISTIALASVASDVVTIDIDEWVHNEVVPHLKRLVLAPTKFLDKWPSDEVKFDVIFIDGCHQSAEVEQDIAKSLQRLAPNGVILFHDTLSVMPSIKKILGYEVPMHLTHNKIGVYPRERFIHVTQPS